MTFGRCDESDRFVFQLFLQLVLGLVPSKMIGVVIARTARQDCLVENDWDYYRRVDKPETLENNFEVFCEAMLNRCGKKVCFIDNPPPEEDDGNSLINLDPFREKSLENVCGVIKKILESNCSYSCGSFSHYLYNNYIKFCEIIKENKFGLTLTTLSLLSWIIGYL